MVQLYYMLKNSVYEYLNIRKVMFFNFQGAAALSGTPLAGLIVELSGQKQVRKFSSSYRLHRVNDKNIKYGSRRNLWYIEEICVKFQSGIEIREQIKQR
jgi:hypothetical protein